MEANQTDLLYMNGAEVPMIFFSLSLTNKYSYRSVLRERVLKSCDILKLGLSVTFKDVVCQICCFNSGSLRAIC